VACVRVRARAHAGIRQRASESRSTGRAFEWRAPVSHAVPRGRGGRGPLDRAPACSHCSGPAEWLGGSAIPDVCMSQRKSSSGMAVRLSDSRLATSLLCELTANLTAEIRSQRISAASCRLRRWLETQLEGCVPIDIVFHGISRGPKSTSCFLFGSGHGSISFRKTVT
jgi:hypothetical protein